VTEIATERQRGLTRRDLLRAGAGAGAAILLSSCEPGENGSKQTHSSTINLSAPRWHKAPSGLAEIRASLLAIDEGNGKSYGSAVAAEIYGKKRIVTVGHVALGKDRDHPNQCRRLTAVYPNRNKSPITEAASVFDDQRDMSVLVPSVMSPGLRAAEIKSPQQYSPVYLGSYQTRANGVPRNPLRGDRPAIYGGIVLGYSAEEGNRPVVLTGLEAYSSDDFNCHEGGSGGGAFDEAGNLVGLLRRLPTEKSQLTPSYIEKEYGVDFTGDVPAMLHTCVLEPLDATFRNLALRLDDC